MVVRILNLLLSAETKDLGCDRSLAPGFVPFWECELDVVTVRFVTGVP